MKYPDNHNVASGHVRLGIDPKRQRRDSLHINREDRFRENMIRLVQNLFTLFLTCFETVILTHAFLAVWL